MKNRKKWVICLLAAAMLVALLLSAQAATTGENGLFSYEMKGNGTLRITDFDWSNYTKNSDIVIPQMIDGYTVTEIGELALSQGDMDYKTVELPYPEMSAENASLIIPNTVTVIGEKAFFNSGIGRVSIPASVKSIGTAAFCTGKLKNATIDTSNERYAVIDSSLYDKQNRELLVLATDTTSVPEGIISLGEYSCMKYGKDYMDCYGDSCFIEISIFPNTLKSIKDFAFFNSIFESNSSDIIFPNLEFIGNFAFAKTEATAHMAFNATLKELSEGAFFNAFYISVDFSKCKQLTTISMRCFEEAIIGSLILPSTIAEIQSRAFYNNVWLLETSIQPKIIGDFAFYHAGRYREEAIKDTYLSEVEYIGAQAFQGSNILLEQTIPECCTFIGEGAFDKQTKLLVKPGSYAESWAQENGYNYDNGAEQDLSWLDGV